MNIDSVYISARCVAVPMSFWQGLYLLEIAMRPIELVRIRVPKVRLDHDAPERVPVERNESENIELMPLHVNA